MSDTTILRKKSRKKASAKMAKKMLKEARKGTGNTPPQYVSISAKVFAQRSEPPLDAQSVIYADQRLSDLQNHGYASSGEISRDSSVHSKGPRSIASSFAASPRRAASPSSLSPSGAEG